MNELKDLLDENHKLRGEIDTMEKSNKMFQDRIAALEKRIYGYKAALDLGQEITPDEAKVRIAELEKERDVFRDAWKLAHIRIVELETALTAIKTGGYGDATNIARAVLKGGTAWPI